MQTYYEVKDAHNMIKLQKVSGIFKYIIYRNFGDHFGNCNVMSPKNMYLLFLYILPEWHSAYKKTEGWIYYEEISDNLPPKVIWIFFSMGRNKHNLGKACSEITIGSR